MEQRCPNCDQLLLADESACWQCGQPLPQAAQSSPQAPDRQEHAARGPLAPVEIYTAWTVVIIVAALVATVLLGRQPRVQAANVPLPDGWTTVSDRERSFAVFLPAEWEQLDAADEEGRRRLQQLLDETAVYGRAAEPLAGFVQDEEPLFLARGNVATERAAYGAFLLVMRSRLLNRLTAAEAVGLAQEGSVAVADARRVTDFERRYVALRVELLLSGEQKMICRQQFTTGEREALLLALCTTPGQLSPDAIDTILGSAQRLAP